MALIKLSNVQKGRYYISEDGDVLDTRTNRTLKHQFRKGYHRVYLYDSNKQKYTLHSVHILVAKMFIGDPPDSERVFIDHIDGDKNNNHFSNLEWVTNLENMTRANRLGLCHSDSDRTLIEDRQRVYDICELLSYGERASNVSRMVGVNADRIHKMITGESYIHISKAYNIRPKHERNPFSKYNIIEIQKPLTDMTNGVALPSIQSQTGVNRRTLAKIRGDIENFKHLILDSTTIERVSYLYNKYGRTE